MTGYGQIQPSVFVVAVGFINPVCHKHRTSEEVKVFLWIFIGFMNALPFIK